MSWFVASDRFRQLSLKAELRHLDEASKRLKQMAMPVYYRIKTPFIITPLAVNCVCFLRKVCSFLRRVVPGPQGQMFTRRALFRDIHIDVLNLDCVSHTAAWADVCLRRCLTETTVVAWILTYIRLPDHTVCTSFKDMRLVLESVTKSTHTQ